MKKLVMVLVLLGAMGMSSSAMAAGYKCEVEGSKRSYLFVLNLDYAIMGGSVFDAQGEFQNWKMKYPKVNVAIAADGGPMMISARDDSKVNWKKERRCWKFKKGVLSATLNSSAQGTTGVVRILPNIAVNPAKRRRCSVPRVMIAPAQKVRCTEI